ncbi:MAG: TetR/AcrR family transcriptional regulator [Clostridiales bacterium]|jgi:AcrR family transcriptional regulator|nr:TetR/AcrR family transcriptional regulator [Clostridiales bacterium]
MNSQNIKEDIRSQRTKKILYQAFFHLLEQRSLKDITVNDICKEAMVHRTTLYKYFDSKYALLEYGVHQVHKELMDQLQEFPPENLQLAACDLSIDYIDTHKNAILHVIEESFTPTLSFLLDKLNGLIAHHGEKHWKSMGYPDFSSPVSSQIIGQFFAGGIAAFILWWLQKGDSIGKEQIKQYLHEIIQTVEKKD